MTDRDPIDGVPAGSDGSAAGLGEPALDAEALQRAESEAAAEAAAIAPAETERASADGVADLVAVGPGPVAGAAPTEPPTEPGYASVAVEDQAVDSGEPTEGLTSADYTVAFSPRQVAVGLAIVAGLVAYAVTRRRGRSRREDG